MKATISISKLINSETMRISIRSPQLGSVVLDMELIEFARALTGLAECPAEITRLIAAKTTPLCLDAMAGLAECVNK